MLLSFLSLSLFECKYEAKKIKSNNFARSNRENSNIAIAKEIKKVLPSILSFISLKRKYEAMSNRKKTIIVKAKENYVTFYLHFYLLLKSNVKERRSRVITLQGAI